MPLGQEGRTITDLILVAVGHQDIIAIEDYISQAGDVTLRYSTTANGTGNGKTTKTLYRQPNYRRVFASWSPPIDPNKPMCQIAIIRLLAVRDGPEKLLTIIKAPHKRRFTTAKDTPTVVVIPVA
jgi:hypothetical protein